MADCQYYTPNIVEVVAASSDQASVLENLLELYIHDFNEFTFSEIQENGRFGYRYLSDYWKEPARHPFLIRGAGALAGFALIRKTESVIDDSEVWDVSEFFILRGRRRFGIGEKAAHEIWRRFPGKWQVRIMDKNTAAKAFWAKIIDDFAGDSAEKSLIQKDGKLWQVYTFNS